MVCEATMEQAVPVGVGDVVVAVGVIPGPEGNAEGPPYGQIPEMVGKLVKAWPLGKHSHHVAGSNPEALWSPQPKPANTASPVLLAEVVALGADVIGGAVIDGACGAGMAATMPQIADKAARDMIRPMVKHLDT